MKKGLQQQRPVEIQRVITLDDEIRERISRRFDPTHPEDTGQRAIMRQALRHLPALIKDIQAAGLDARPDGKGEQRRPVDENVWNKLGEAAAQVGLDRQILLRALLRRELGITKD